MFKLDYTTNNPRWGRSGVKFSDLSEYFKTLGFLSNISHYKGKGGNKTYFENSISMHIEGNYLDGAWAKECRIHYYKDMKYLMDYLPDICEASSAGLENSITCRINSNQYIKHLINDYSFSVYGSGYVKNVYPDKNNYNILVSKLKYFELDDNEIKSIMLYFDTGWNL